MKSFDDAVSKHKNNLIENLSQFNEGHRVRDLLMDIESNKSDYEYYFNSGQQSKQAEVDELKREMTNKTNEAYADGQKSMRKMIKSNEDELQKRIDDLKYFCIKGVESNMLSIEYNQALIGMYKILKGNTNDH